MSKCLPNTILEIEIEIQLRAALI